MADDVGLTLDAFIVLIEVQLLLEIDVLRTLRQLIAFDDEILANKLECWPVKLIFLLGHVVVQ